MISNRLILFAGCLATLLVLLFPSKGVEAQTLPTVSGVWLTEDGSTHVEFYSCGALLCGRIVWLREPIDPTTGRNWLDRFNRVASKRNRPLIGLDIVNDLRPTSSNSLSGKLYNPVDGRTYSGSLQKIGNELQLKGCVFGGLICQSERWTRVSS